MPLKLENDQSIPKVPLKLSKYPLNLKKTKYAQKPLKITKIILKPKK